MKALGQTARGRVAAFFCCGVTMFLGIGGAFAQSPGLASKAVDDVAEAGWGRRAEWAELSRGVGRMRRFRSSPFWVWMQKGEVVLADAALGRREVRIRDLWTLLRHTFETMQPWAAQ